MRFTWLAKPSRFHMVCETMKRFTWFVKPCEIRTIKPIKFHMVRWSPQNHVKSLIHMDGKGLMHFRFTGFHHSERVHPASRRFPIRQLV